MPIWRTTRLIDVEKRSGAEGQLIYLLAHEIDLRAKWGLQIATVGGML